VQDAQRRAAPVTERRLQAFGERLGTKNAAIQQQRVGTGIAGCASPVGQRLPRRCRVPPEERRRDGG
jgi:hypothetical protein